jgi:hypothetical protein
MENSTLVVCHFVGRQLFIGLKSRPSYLAAIPPTKISLRRKNLKQKTSFESSIRD